MKNTLEPVIVFPRSPRIKEYISYYYFFDGKHENPNFEFWHYPHFQTSLVFFENAELREHGAIRSITAVDEHKFQYIFNRNFFRAKREVINGRLNIIGIVFHPLGINHFQYGHSKNIDGFSGLDISEVFSEKDDLDRVKRLDEMFEKRYQDFDAPIIKAAIAIIIKKKGDIFLNDLSALLNTSRRTILRNFRSHLNCSFQEFKHVVKFRKAMEYHHQETQSLKLSDLAYELNYYDQSDLIKAFKAMTNETPKKLLAKIAPLSEKLLWKHD